MMFSRQFRALLRFACLWAVPSFALGAALGVYRWLTSADLTTLSSSMGIWILGHALAYGALGLIAGLDVGLLLAHAERGRQVAELAVGRVVLWSTVGGAGPAIIFAALAVAFGAPAIFYLPLLGLGVASAAISATVAVSAVAAAKRGALPPSPAPPRLPAT